MLLQNPKNINLSPDTFRCFNTIHNTILSCILHEEETFAAILYQEVQLNVVQFVLTSPQSRLYL